jgi:hypothetical protein
MIIFEYFGIVNIKGRINLIIFSSALFSLYQNVRPSRYLSRAVHQERKIQGERLTILDLLIY